MLIEGLKLIVRHKEVYGQVRLYPENDFAKMMCELLEQKALTERQVRIIGRLAAIQTNYVKD